MADKTQIPDLPRYQDIEEKVIKREKFDEAAFKQMIRSLHLKVTDQRLLILEALHSGKRTHVTAQEVYEIVSEKDSSLGFATVYRFLRKLTEAALVTEVRMGGLPARYEITPKSHHDHLTCTHCGKIVEFENDAIERLQDQVAAQFGFKLTSHVLELYGVCSDCQRREGQLARKPKV
ncbi:MAG: Fur family transcriptional regulator [Bdellovibrio sp.]